MKLAADSAAILALDGTLVYVEDLQTICAVVVAFPDQPPRESPHEIFTPGSVKARRISPFSAALKLVPVGELSPVNQDFLTHFREWRAEHGPNYVVGGVASAPEDAPPAKPSRAQLRAKCATCGEQRGHFNHPDQHEFVPPAADAAPAPSTKRSERSAKQTSPSGRYKLVSTNLKKARAVDDRYKEDNRGHRVFNVLRGLPDSTGTLEDIVLGLVKDGGKIPGDPEKLVRRVMQQLQSDEYGALVQVLA